MTIKIEWITTTNYPYSANTSTGGSYYDYLATKVLSENFDFELKWIRRENSSNIIQRMMNEYRFIEKLANLKLDGDINIRTHLPIALTPFRRRARNIAIVHQFCKFPTFDSYYIPLFFKNLKRMDKIVTVSKYWQNWFQNKGYKKTKIIYNSFDVEEFNFTQKELDEFKTKYNLMDDKPILYIGVLRKGKGVEETFDALKDLDVHLIATAGKAVHSSIPHLSLERREYLRLLKCSTIVIQMSQLLEGWCRVLHEAMLCKTPVIGSGMGGMAELLSGGGQIICRDFKDLKGKVKQLLENENLRKEIGERGYEFAKEFTYERFRGSWLELIDELIS